MKVLSRKKKYMSSWIFLRIMRRKGKKQEEEEAALDREKAYAGSNAQYQKRNLEKSAVLKGMNLQEGATARDRNEQIGGHKA